MKLVAPEAARSLVKPGRKDNAADAAALCEAARRPEAKFKDIRLDPFRDHGTNVPLHPECQAFCRGHQPPTLIVWGKSDKTFPAAGPAGHRAFRARR